MSNKKKKTFKQIAPRWWSYIKRHGLEHIFLAPSKTRAYSRSKGLPTLMISDVTSCIIGEAHGFTNDYGDTTSEKYCSSCDQLSLELCTDDPVRFTKGIQNLEAHWNKEHVNKK